MSLLSIFVTITLPVIICGVYIIYYFNMIEKKQGGAQK